MGSQDLQTARYDQLIRRVGGLYGGGSKVVEALPELFPVLELENTTPELLALTGWRTAWQSSLRPAVAGEVSKSQIFNPVGSGSLVVVTQVGLHVDVAQRPVQMEIVTVQLASPVPGLFRDARFGVPRNTTAQIASINNVPTGGGLRVIVDALQIFIRDDNGLVVLTPGTGLDVGTVNSQIALTVNYFWRERLALESEINFP